MTPEGSGSGRRQVPPTTARAACSFRRRASVFPSVAVASAPAADNACAHRSVRTRGPGAPRSFSSPGQVPATLQTRGTAHQAGRQPAPRWFRRARTASRQKFWTPALEFVRCLVLKFAAVCVCACVCSCVPIIPCRVLPWPAVLFPLFSEAPAVMPRERFSVSEWTTARSVRRPPSPSSLTFCRRCPW